MTDKATTSLQPLPIDAWEPTKNTLHLYLQVVGKIQLALMPRKNHWWNITFLLSSKGLITHLMPYGDLTFQVHFNFIDNQVEINTSKGECEIFPLKDGVSVAEFYETVFARLHKLGIDVQIIAHPYGFTDEHPMVTPFAEIKQFHSYDADHVLRYWNLLTWVNEVFIEFSGRFYGKTSPVQLFWHHMDLVVTRFCGRRAPALPETSNISNKDAYSHELISFGFWAGDEKVRNAAFYSYTYPSPEGIEKESLGTGKGKWVDAMALLNYDDLLKEREPKTALLDFLEHCYMAGAKLAKWDIDDLKVVSLTKL